MQRYTSSWLLFCITYLFYAILALFFSRPAEMTMTAGDEPHYLLAAHSLFYDHDLQLRNNYEARDFTAFFDGPTLDIGAYIYDYHGREVNHQAWLGMPLLLVVPYGLGGRVGVLLALALLMSLSMVLVFQSITCYVKRSTAWLTTLFCALTYPLAIYSQQIYPDAPIMALLSLALWLSVKQRFKNPSYNALLLGISVAIMPHFHPKYAVLSGLLYLWYLWRQRHLFRSQLSGSLVMILPLAGSFLAWMYLTYGEISTHTFITPSIGRYAGSGVDRGILGLWFDQEYGLFFFAPFYLLAGYGFWKMWKNPAQKQDALGLALIYAGYHLLNGCYYDWDGGLSPTPRYLVAVLPILVLWSAQAVESLQHEQRWLQIVGLGAATVWITVTILFIRRPLMFGFEAGSNTALRVHYHLLTLAEWLPSFKVNSTLGVYTRLLILAIVIVLFFKVSDFLNRRLFAS